MNNWYKIIKKAQEDPHQIAEEMGKIEDPVQKAIIEHLYFDVNQEPIIKSYLPNIDEINLENFKNLSFKNTKNIAENIAEKLKLLNLIIQRKEEFNDKYKEFKNNKMSALDFQIYIGDFISFIDNYAIPKAKDITYLNQKEEIVFEEFIDFFRKEILVFFESQIKEIFEMGSINLNEFDENMEYVDSAIEDLKNFLK